MKLIIAKWIAEQLLGFVIRNHGGIEESRYKIVYLYKGADVHSVDFNINPDNLVWMRAAMVTNPLDPPENWDLWQLQKRD